ncbi:MAG: hypothetical protein WD266_03630 [Balneolales bacterium]
MPEELDELLSDPDPEKAQHVTKALMQMKKIEIAGLRKAYERANQKNRRVSLNAYGQQSGGPG